MTFEELRIKLQGGPAQERPGRFGLCCDIPALPPEAFDSIPGMKVTETDFPGCYRFFVPVAEGEALYVGVVEISGSSKNHVKGTLELFPRFGGAQIPD